MKVKICGIMDVNSAHVAVQAGADALGFVFAKSKRQITPDQAIQIIDSLPNDVEKVGVFVNEEPQVIESIAQYCGLSMIQLHGEESPEMCQEYSLPVIKAFGIGKKQDLLNTDEYPTDYVLVDSPKGAFQGGNGLRFDWSLLNDWNSNKKLILAGGLTPDNVKEAITVVRPFMVDVSSGVESGGKKDHEKIKAFIENAKGAEHI
ncbi:phosphoribosylanthranilate isomerase [Peribacillus alkalitolerans]|uniref:phosphoribosylanthranilate isomerase n=1 Tax=Peribacillus alkalitolerans TaxID=1550385 RepID=UPI0013D518EC|nr:phosphoribosylanthranilate isomerase [Peribacillus alkalitolerans]